MYTILNLSGKFFASSISLDAMMCVMRERWAGTLVDENGKVLFDIKADRENQGVKVTDQQARNERALAWSRRSPIREVAASTRRLEEAGTPR